MTARSAGTCPSSASRPNPEHRNHEASDEAVICGAGIAGIALAECLRSTGWTVTLVDRAPGPREQGFMLDFWGIGYAAAEAMGTLPRLKELAYPITEWTYVDASGRRTARLDATGFLRAQRGRLLSIMRPDIERALLEQLGDGIDLRYGHTVDTFQDTAGGVRVGLSDGSTVDADLLAGADGIHSAVRRALFGEERKFLRYLGFHLAVWLFDDPELHRRLGSRFSFTDTCDRQLGLYGTRGGKIAAFAAHRAPEPAHPRDPAATIRTTYGQLGWLVPRALEQLPAPDEIYYDEMSQIELPQWSRGHVVLLGDACGAVTPLASQGASLAFGGAFLLADRLENSASVPAALAEYQRRWQPLVTARQRGARRGADWFLPRSTAQLRLRRLAARLTGLPGVTRLISAAVAGKTGTTLNVPRW